MDELEKRIFKIIKHAPNEDGYVEDSIASQGVNQIKQAIIDSGYSKSPLTSIREKMAIQGMMTGQEWYDKYKKELIENYDLRSPAFTSIQAVEAAMKVAGLASLDK